MAAKKESVEMEQKGDVYVKCSVEVNRPVKEVFAFLANPENSSKWIAGVMRMSLSTKEGIRVGARGVQVRRWLGREAATEWEVTEFEPNRVIAIETTSGPIVPFGVAEYVEPLDRGTLVTVVAQGSPRGVLKVAMPLAARMYERQLDADLATLKGLLESEAREGFFSEEW
jgi:uncharacterized protein YndB with AHSA1/START domain